MILSNTPCKRPAYKSRHIIWRQGSSFILATKKVKFHVTPHLSSFFFPPHSFHYWFKVQPSTSEVEHSDLYFIASLVTVNSIGSALDLGSGTQTRAALLVAQVSEPSSQHCHRSSHKPKSAILPDFSYPLINSSLGFSLAWVVLASLGNPHPRPLLADILIF